MDLLNRLAIVTGVSKGIGRATAEALLREGAVVAGWGRTRSDLAHERFHFYSCDVSQPGQVEQAYQQTLLDTGLAVSVLINNAGLGIIGAAETQSSEDWHRMFDTNVHGLMYCTRQVISSMRDQQLGHIINISSIAGKLGVEQMSGYSATKYAVRGYSEAIYKELRPHGIKVTCLFPGSVETHFFDDMPGVSTGPHMLQPEDIAASLLHCLKAPFNCHHVELEIRPLQPQPKKK